MGHAFISCKEELNDFLPNKKKDRVITCEFNGNPSIKHLIESIGIPHTEIGQLLVNERSVDFNYQVQLDDSIIAFPASPYCDEITKLFLDGKLTMEPRFILDNHLGKLATYLRILGFDASYHNKYQDDQLALIAAESLVILLTRDRQLLMRKTIRYGYWIRSLEPENQIKEILNRFGLGGLITPFQRCLRCNTSLRKVDKEAILHRLEPLTKKYYWEFRICPNCERIYWKGSHYERMQKLISRVTDKTK